VPFAALGLPEWPDLDDETVDAAWRQIAAETHPDRPDGGNLARYTQASAAYNEICCPWGRTEAFADLLDQAWAKAATTPTPATTRPASNPTTPPTGRGPPARGIPNSARSCWTRCSTS